MPVITSILICLALSGVTTIGLYRLAMAESQRDRRIRMDPDRKLVGTAVYTRMFLNAMFSMSLVFAYFYFGRGFLTYEGPVAPWRFVVEPLGVLMVYDFFYYLMHRYPFHEWTFLKRVHAVHHQARFPVSIDSLFLHPVENFLGLTLLASTTFLLGPIHVTSFFVMFLIYTQLNVIVHCGYKFPGPLAFLTTLAHKHDIHHEQKVPGNYANLTPLYDILFRTAH